MPPAPTPSDSPVGQDCPESDDGRGIDPNKIGQKAVEKGLITAEQLGGMSERAVQNLIFHPGFSTRSSVSEISGRGVGMDVVIL